MSGLAVDYRGGRRTADLEEARTLMLELERLRHERLAGVDTGILGGREMN